MLPIDRLPQSYAKECDSRSRRSWWSSCRGGRRRRTSITFVLPPCATTYSLRHIHRFLTLLPPTAYRSRRCGPCRSSRSGCCGSCRSLQSLPTKSAVTAPYQFASALSVTCAGRMPNRPPILTAEVILYWESLPTTTQIRPISIAGFSSANTTRL